MEKQEFMEWLRENFDVPGSTQRIIENIIDYVEKLPEEEHYSALEELLSGGIGLTSAEIRQIYL